MQRPNRGVEGFMGGGCKIRKRGCSSLSSSSSLMQNYRFKRAIIVGKRGGKSTPVPTWKMNLRSPSSTAGISVSSQHRTPSHNGDKGKQAAVSARKLATAIWEMSEIPSPQRKEGRRCKEIRGRDRNMRSVQSGLISPHLSDPSHSPSSETTNRSKSRNYGRRIPVIPQKFRPIESYNHRAVDSLSNASFMEVETRSRGFTPTNSARGTKSSLKHVSNGLKTSKELLKVLNHIWGLEEQHSSSRSHVSALRVELERSRTQVDQLIEVQRSDRNEINYLKKQFMEEKMAWKSKEQERIKAAAKSTIEELDLEKKLRRRVERVSKKLEVELTETKTALSKATKELQSERRSREMIEKVCNEIVRGVGEDKAEVEQMKKESARVREDLEKEREMLQLADVWREERVQMKLSEAKFQFEEKNEAVDQLRNELEAFLKNKRINSTRIGCRNLGGKLEVDDQVQVPHPSKINVFQHNAEGEVVDGEEDEDGELDSADSDLHSIELNMDNNSKSFSWSYSNGTMQEATKMESVEENTNRRCSNYEDSLRGSFSLNRGIPQGVEWNCSAKNSQDLGSMFDERRISQSSSLPGKQDNKLDFNAERYRSVKGLRDHLLSGSRLASTRSIRSPMRQWCQTQPLPGDKDYEGPNVDKKVKPLKETGSKARLAGGKGENHSYKHNQLQVAPKT